ncbi:hypothetical protein VKT23_001247 [Stygiomarasmius scandens]|uniref:Uncharacterized protein n=1 Tax=Marasmiellus scandens TaxID=2682957 RepID=A0ABR1KCF8_9AGAR
MPAIPSLQTGPPLPSSFKRKELEQLALRRIHAEFQFLPTLTEEHLLPPGNVRGCEEGAGREYMKYYVESFIDFKRYSEQEIGVIEEVGVSKMHILSDDILRRLSHKYAPGSTSEDVGRLFLWMSWLVDVKDLEVFMLVAEKVLHPLVSAVGNALLKYIEQLNRKNERQRLLNVFARRALPTLKRRRKSPSLSPSPRRVRHPAHLPSRIQNPPALSLVGLSSLSPMGSMSVIKKTLSKPIKNQGGVGPSSTLPAPSTSTLKSNAAFRPVCRRTLFPALLPLRRSARLSGSIFAQDNGISSISSSASDTIESTKRNRKLLCN